MDVIELLDKLDELSSWRKKELSQARFLAENAKNKDSERYLCRVWVMVMYAHCDNFLQESTRTYLEYLKNNLDYKNPYNYKLMWLVYRGKNKITSSDKYKSLIDHYNDDESVFFDESIISEILNSGNFEYKRLRYFCDWIMQIKYDHEMFVDFCKIIKKKRDGIAHGEESYVEKPDDCLDWHNKTILFIDSLKESLIESARGNLLTKQVVSRE